MICEDAQKIYSHVFLNHNSEIMEVFDALSQIFEIKSPIIIISDTDDKNIEYISNLSGMYPNLKIVENPFDNEVIAKGKIVIGPINARRNNKVIGNSDINIENVNVGYDNTIESKGNLVVNYVNVDHNNRMIAKYYIKTKIEFHENEK